MNTQPHAIALLRVSFGLLLFAHGFVMKIMGFGLDGTMAFFGSLGFPPILGAVVALAETATGLALVAGVLVRTASLLILPILLGATWQHLGQGWVFSAPGGGWEFPALLSVLALVQAGLGAGSFALRLPVPGRRAALPQAA